MKKPLLQGLILFILCFSVLGSVLFQAPGFVTSDDYYHVRISEEIIKQQTIRLHFPWLPLTILSPERYTDHHLLFHIILAPVVHFFGSFGAEVVTVTIASGVFLMFWILLRRMRVHYPLLWTIALFGMSSFFLYRLLMIRPSGMSLLLLLISLILMFSKRYKPLVLVGFLYTWLFDGFPMLLAFTVMYIIATFITSRKIIWQPIFYSLLGISLGLLLNPYFPQNTFFIIDHLQAKIFFDQSIPVGEEWYPLTTRQVLYYFPGATLAMLIGFIFSWSGSRKRDEIDFTVLFIALFTGGLALYAIRFFEYFPLFALLFAAVSLGRNMKKFTGNKKMPALLLAIITAVFGFLSLKFSFDNLKHVRSIDEFKGASHWLEQNTDPGTLIFTTGFNDFSRLFFYNQQNVYVIGLDPTYLAYADRNMYEKYRQITAGEAKYPSFHIAETFHTSYIVSSKQLHQSFNQQALQDANLQLVFEDEFNYVWTIPMPIE